MCLGKINDVASWCSFSQAFQVLNANDRTQKVLHIIYQCYCVRASKVSCACPVKSKGHQIKTYQTFSELKHDYVIKILVFII